MFCPNCGANLPEDARHCGNCGTPLSAEQPVATEVASPEAPVQPQVAFTDRDNILTKRKFVATTDDSAVKTCKILALVMTFLAIIAMVASYFVTNNTSFEDIPVISLALDLVNDNTDEDINSGEFKEKLSDKLDELEDVYEKEKNTLTAEEQKLCEDLLDVGRDLTKDFSFNNLVKIGDVFEDFSTIDSSRLNIDKSIFEDFNEGMDVVAPILQYGLLGFMLFALLFTVFGGFFRIRGLVIAGLIFSLLYTLPFCSMLFVILIFAINLTIIIALSIINSKYKKLIRERYRV